MAKQESALGEAQRAKPSRAASCRDAQVGQPRVTLSRAQGVTCCAWGPEQFCPGVLGLPHAVGFICVSAEGQVVGKRKGGIASLKQLKDVCGLPS